jgi:hypothetical protein
MHFEYLTYLPISKILKYTNTLHFKTLLFRISGIYMTVSKSLSEFYFYIVNDACKEWFTRNAEVDV